MQGLSCGLTNRIWTPPKYKGLIERDGMREQPAVGYTAPEVDFVMVSANMRFVSFLR